MSYSNASLTANPNPHPNLDPMLTLVLALFEGQVLQADQAPKLVKVAQLGFGSGIVLGLRGGGHFQQISHRMSWHS